MIRIAGGSPLHGRITLPSDKSIAHRRILLAGLQTQHCTIEIEQCGEDLFSTIGCLRRLGVGIDLSMLSPTKVAVNIDGRSIHHSDRALDCGNSGTTARLLTGILAGYPFNTTLTGDASLSRRPMQRIINPLTMMGAQIDSVDGVLPLTIRGGKLNGIDYTLPVASAQVKSAILLAGMHAEGSTFVRETVATRDHTERLLQLKPHISDGEIIWRIDQGHGYNVESGEVPGDPSAGIFWIVATLLNEASSTEFHHLGLNPIRIEYLSLLRAAGANLQWKVTSEEGGEPVGVLTVRGGGAYSFDIAKSQVPALIDEIPALAILAAASGGSFRIAGADELRKKESDRISALVAGLRAMGCDVEEYPDGFTFGTGHRLKGARVDGVNDHRIVMAFAIAALAATGETTIHRDESVAISYPTFFEQLHLSTGAVQ